MEARTSPERGSRDWRREQVGLQNELDSCLELLADREFEGPAEITEVARRLRTVYCHEDFRHRYSNIVDVIEDVQSFTGSEATDNKLDEFRNYIESVQARATCMANNLRYILTYDSQPDDGIEDHDDIIWLRGNKSFEKLYDHVALEAKREGYSGERVRTLTDELNDAETELSNANTAVQQAQKGLDDSRKAVRKANKKAKSLQRETIAILGVFSAITLAFNASVSFTASSISSANSCASSVFRIAFVVAVVGFFLLNILYVAFAFVYRIVEGEDDEGAGSGWLGRFVNKWVIILMEVISVGLIVAFGVLAVLI